jgi:streptogramin lyase
LATDATSFEQAFDLPAGSGPARMALGPDGNLWVTMYDASAIDRIAPNGAATRFPLPPGRGPNDIAQGPDGALWFTESGPAKIGRLALDSGSGGGGGGGGGTGGGGGGIIVDKVPPRFLGRAAFAPTRFRVASGRTPTTARKQTIP